MNIDFTLAGAVIITGLVVVFVALIGLSLIVWLIGKLFVSTGLGSPKKPAQPAAAPKPAAPAAPKAAPQQAAAPAPAPAAPAAPVPAPASTMVIQPIVEEGIGDDIIAVISAAVASMFGGGESGQPAAEGGFVLRSIRRARERTSWAQAGMMQNTQPF